MQISRYENSIIYGPIISRFFLIALAVFIAIVWIFIDHKDSSTRILSLIIGAVLGSISFYYIGLKVYYLNRPKSVEISENGVKLNMRLGKRPVIIAWPDVRIIGIQTYLIGKKDGVIYNDIRWYYPIDYSISLELRESYLQHVGKYPPTRFDELCPGMEKDMLAMSSSQWNRKYERFKKK